MRRVILPKPNTKLAIVCVGGGAKGRWQAGALFALHELGYAEAASILVGTSVGGLNACALAMSMAQGLGADLLRDAWSKIKANSDVYYPDMPPAGLPLTLPRYLGALRSFIWGESLCDTEALGRLCQWVFAEDTADQVKSATGQDVYTRAFNYVTGQAETLGGSMKLKDMARATSAIEGVFPDHMINGQPYGDGGLLDNQPVDIAIEKGATHVIVVYCAPDGSPKDPGQDDSKNRVTGMARALRAMDRAIASHEDEVWARCAAHPEVKFMPIYPAMDTGPVLDFTNQRLFQDGYVIAFGAAQMQEMAFDFIA